MTRSPEEETTPAADEPPSPPSGADASLPEGDVHIDVCFETADVDPPARDWLAAQLRRAVLLAGLAPAALALRVVDDAEMDRLHRLHSGVEGTTDVLTFDNRDRADQAIDGDLVLCLDEAVRRAGDLGHDTRLELLLYALHGALHLDGEDDHDPEAHRRMHEREDRVLGQLGFGPVFYGRSGRQTTNRGASA